MNFEIGHENFGTQGLELCHELDVGELDKNLVALKISGLDRWKSVKGRLLEMTKGKWRSGRSIPVGRAQWVSKTFV